VCARSRSTLRSSGRGGRQPVGRATRVLVDNDACAGFGSLLQPQSGHGTPTFPPSAPRPPPPRRQTSAWRSTAAHLRISSVTSASGSPDAASVTGGTRSSARAVLRLSGGQRDLVGFGGEGKCATLAAVLCPCGREGHRRGSKQPAGVHSALPTDGQASGSAPGAAAPPRA
jgi:hypothetical protein